MENAVSALKIAFAVFVFVLGLVMLFSMASQAKNTADTLISKVDKTNYYTYLGKTTDIDTNGNRIVSIYDIIPVLYRYTQENYGVTIVDKSGNIVARFDLDTEVACNAWSSYTDDQKRTFVTGSVDKNGIYKGGIKEIISKVNSIADKEVIEKVVDGDEIPYIEAIFENSYNQNEKKDGLNHEIQYLCPWTGSSNLIAQRVDSDISRNNNLF